MERAINNECGCCAEKAPPPANVKQWPRRVRMGLGAALFAAGMLGDFGRRRNWGSFWQVTC